MLKARTGPQLAALHGTASFIGRCLDRAAGEGKPLRAENVPKTAEWRLFPEGEESEGNPRRQGRSRGGRCDAVRAQQHRGNLVTERKRAAVTCGLLEPWRFV